MRSILIVAALAAASLLLSSPKVFAQDDLTFDNKVTMGNISDATGSRFGLKSYMDAYKARMKLTDGNSSFMQALLVDPPMTFIDAMDEYKQNKGSPTASTFGIKAFDIQNVLIKTFTGLLLVVFVGLAVLSGLQKVATGQGDLNYVQIALKFFMGIIVIFYPIFLYAGVRVLQTGGLWAIQSAITMTTNAAGNSTLLANAKNASFVKQDADAVYFDLVNQVQADIGPYIKLGSPQEVVDSVKKWNLAAPKADPKLVELEVPAIDDMPGLSRAAGEITSRFQEIVAYNTDLKAEKDTMTTQYLKDVASDITAAKTTRDTFKKALKTKIMAKAKEIYNTETKSLLGTVWDWIKSLPSTISQTVTSAIAWVVIPIASWILLRVSCLVMELTLIVTSLMFPLWFLDSTKKAFIGTFNTLLMTAIVPAVGTVLLLIFESIATTLYASLLWISLLPGYFWTFQYAYLIFWIVGTILILWKTAGISKAMLEGGSFVGQYLGGLATAGVTSALAGAGLAGSLQSLAMPTGNTGALGQGGGDGGKAGAQNFAQGQLNDAARDGDTIARAANNVEGNAPDVMGAGARPGVAPPSNAAKGVLGGNKNEKKGSKMEKQLNAQRAAESAGGAGVGADAGASGNDAGLGNTPAGSSTVGNSRSKTQSGGSKSAIPGRPLKELPSMGVSLNPKTWGNLPSGLARRAATHASNAAVLTNPFNPHGAAARRATLGIVGKTALAAVVSGGDAGRMASIAGASLVSKKLGIDRWGGNKKDGKHPGSFT